VIYIKGFYGPEWWRKVDEENAHDCTPEQMDEAVQGYFTADALPLNNEPGISGRVCKHVVVVKTFTLVRYQNLIVSQSMA